MSRVQLSINVSDFDAAVAFYSRLLGAAPAKLRPGYANFAIDDPPLKLVLNSLSLAFMRTAGGVVRCAMLQRRRWPRRPGPDQPQRGCPGGCGLMGWAHGGAGGVCWPGG